MGPLAHNEAIAGGKLILNEACVQEGLA
jgi:hypothetical protein